MGPMGEEISEFDDLCQGSRNPNSYFVALNVTVAKARKSFSVNGASLLDGIVAFDAAEVARMNLGQLNLIEVSSFCGPDALFWGYDAARPESLESTPLFSMKQWSGDAVPVFDGAPLMDAATELFGTLERKAFPIAPGSHCPAAYKSIVLDRPGMIYAACAVGIRHPDDRSATMLMEDVGLVSQENRGDMAAWRTAMTRSLAESVLAVARNQKIRCQKIFVVVAEVEVGPDEVGCALTLLPYFTLAKNAVPADGLDGLRSMSLEEWRKSVKT